MPGLCTRVLEHTHIHGCFVGRKPHGAIALDDEQDLVLVGSCTRANANGQ